MAEMQFRICIQGQNITTFFGVTIPLFTGSKSKHQQLQKAENLTPDPDAGSES